MEYFIYGIGLIIGGGFFSLMLPEKAKGYAVSLFTGLGAACILSPSINVLLGQSIPSLAVEISYPIGTTNISIDHLSAFFLIIISVMSFIGTIYTIGYMKVYNGKGRTVTSHFFFLSVLIASMPLVVVVQNALAFLIVWEIMSLSSFFLLSFENEKEEVYNAGINYLIAMHIGVLFIITGFVLLSIKSESLDFNSFKDVLNADKWQTNIIFLLLFIGFGTKAGFIPLHTWLPKAYPAAPSHISGLMSGVMINTAIYGILRIITLIKLPSIEIAYFVLIISLISGILGVAYAIAQSDIKKLLAYSSVENIGVIGIGIGVGLLGMAYHKPSLTVLGFSGGMLHILNQSLFKSLLFYSTGVVYLQTHILHMEKLGGLIRPMLFTGICFLVGSLAISGLPPFNGFVSEFLIYWGMLTGLKSGYVLLSVMIVLSFSGLAFIGAMALLCFTKVFSIVFLGSPRSDLHEKPIDVHWTMKAAMGFQILLIFAIGFLPQYIFIGISKAAHGLFGEISPEIFTSYFNTLCDVSRGLAVFMGIFILLFLGRYLLLRKRRVYRYKTWDCGYQAGNTRMQYTGASYVEPFMTLIRPIFKTKIRENKPIGLFPSRSTYESQTDDKFEHAVIHPIIKRIEKFLNAFTWIQSGSTQQYILYGLIFLILITLWIMVV